MPEAGLTKGPDGLLYQVTSEKLTEHAANTESTEQLVESQLVELKAYVESLEAEWRGIAATTFQELMVRWDVNARALREALLGIAATLRGNATHFDQAEEHATRGLGAIGSSLPPARLN